MIMKTKIVLFCIFYLFYASLYSQIEVENVYEETIKSDCEESISIFYDNEIPKKYKKYMKKYKQENPNTISIGFGDGFVDGKNIEVYNNSSLVLKKSIETDESLGIVLNTSVEIEYKSHNEAHYITLRIPEEKRCTTFLLDTRYNFLNISLYDGKWYLFYKMSFTEYI